MRLPCIRPGLGLLLALSALIAPVAVHAGPQWSGIQGRALIESFVTTPPETNVVATRLPIKTVIRIYAAKSGRLVQTVNTDDSGRFVALLQPGQYRLEPAVIWDGRILGPGQAITMDFGHLIQNAPVQTVRVSAFRSRSVDC